MRIAQIAPICLSLPPASYGGVELIVSSLTESLVKRGHEVTLYAPGDSKTGARLKSFFKKSLGMGNDCPEFCIANANFAFQDADSFDVIHSHIGFYGFPFSKYAKPPVVTTLHNDIIKENDTFFEYYKDVCTFVAVSQNQCKRMSALKVDGYIHNGIDVNRFQFSPNKKDYLLFIGNISKNKGADIAIKAAIQLQKKLLLVGKIDPVHKLFFDQEIKPFIDNKQIIFESLADHTRKQLLYSNATCLLFPIDWEEPFGLIMLEALACGTPVVAFNRGSVPEIIVNGKIGFGVDSFEEFLKAIIAVENLDPWECRTYVEEFFSVEKMTDQYELLYKKLMREKEQGQRLLVRLVNPGNYNLP
ncbi:MAG: glycosyltransferase family 4 protein [Candidatus Omnitrophota bacterium]|nr:glycosyltransferase family 4 protein [Candidatus Omnitrophota bacterium]